MKQRLSRILPFTLFPAIALGTGWLSSTLTRYGLENVYPNLLKSPLTPPGYVFPIAWTILYLLMGIGMAMVWNKSPQDRVPTLRLWGFQLVLNFFWSILFFGWNNPLGALLCLAVLFLAVLLMTLRFLLRKPRGFLASAALSAVAALCRLSERRGMASEPLTEQEKNPL